MSICPGEILLTFGRQRITLLLGCEERKMDLRKAAELQLKFSKRVNLRWEERDARLVGGADFSYDQKKKKIGASIVIFHIPEFKLVETAHAIREVKFPYIPGYLSFREAPAFIAAYQEIKTIPEVILVDGNGIAHPRKMGLASYVGVVLDICTVGCAKTPFFPFTLPNKNKGAFTFFRNDKQENVGICLRTRTDVKPIFVSPGHRIDFLNAVRIVLECSRYRIPEPLRKAHSTASQIFLENEQSFCSNSGAPSKNGPVS